GAITSVTSSQRPSLVPFLGPSAQLLETLTRSRVIWVQRDSLGKFLFGSFEISRGSVQRAQSGVRLCGARVGAARGLQLAQGFVGAPFLHRQYSEVVVRSVVRRRD